MWAQLSPRGSGRSLIGDLDLDGVLDIISMHGDVRAADSTTLERIFPGFWSMGGLVNMDDDPNPEVVYVAWTDQPSPTVVARQHDGTFIYEWVPGPTADMRCPPCFGDFDGDGRAETALPTGEELIVIDDTGLTSWSIPVSDTSGAAGCSVFDFDLDGIPEILYRDQRDLRVIDGRDGSVLWQIASLSQTQYEFPLVADIDRDGSAEIVLYDGNSGNRSIIRSYGNPRWPPARGIWNQENHVVTNVREDGSVVSDAPLRWLSGNDFRGQANSCACTGPLVDVTAGEILCGSTTACFQAEVQGGLAPHRATWDFGDGSPPVEAENPCHSYAAPGTYLVRVSISDAVDCPDEAALTLVVPEDPSIDFQGMPPCPAVETCFTATVSGGAQPVEATWDFDDGTATATSDTACHSFDGPEWKVTLFVRDANGCLAEATRSGSFAELPANVGPVLFATGHGDPQAATIEGSFVWTDDRGQPRPPTDTYFIARGTRADVLTRIPGTEGHAARSWVDLTPAAVALPGLHFLKVFAEDECGQVSAD